MGLIVEIDQVYLAAMISRIRRHDFHTALILFVCLLLAACAQKPNLKPFHSDGCSLFPDKDAQRGDSWCQCCFDHDYAYWKGGTEKERLQADQALRACILKRTSDSNLAVLVYAGVRAGGSRHFPTWYRWGYGWPFRMAPISDSLRLEEIATQSTIDRTRLIKSTCGE